MAVRPRLPLLLALVLAAGPAPLAAQAPAVAVGAPVPAFRFTALDDTARVLTPEALRGRVYLLDFWATWCAPCLRDMPVLHALHARYAARGFEIVSLSVDRSPDVVRRFRAGAWRMPWAHAHLDDAANRAVSPVFDVAGLPRTVLVDADGRVAAVDARGRRLEEAVARLLPD